MRALVLGLLIVALGCGRKAERQANPAGDAAPQLHDDDDDHSAAEEEEARRLLKPGGHFIEEGDMVLRTKMVRLVAQRTQIADEYRATESAYKSASDAERPALDARLKELKKRGEAIEDEYQKLTGRPPDDLKAKVDALAVESEKLDQEYAAVLEQYKGASASEKPALDEKLKDLLRRKQANTEARGALPKGGPPPRSVN